jgi:hypothetical protein
MRIAIVQFLLTVAIVGLYLFASGEWWLPYVELALWVMTMIATVYAAEVAMALYDTRLWYNVLVVSTAMSLPQTIFAIQLARQGHPVAAFIDTLGSTLVDAVLVTAVVRRHLIGTPTMWSFFGYMALWSVAALYVNLHTYPDFPFKMPDWLLALLGLVLPAVMLIGRARFSGVPLSAWLVLFNHAIATGFVSFYLSDVIVHTFHVSEVHLGVVSTVLATLPDFIVAMLMRGVVAKILSETAADFEVVATMLAAATHDQITIPALVLLFYPDAAPYYPHFFNIGVVLVKFTLLSRRAFWWIGLPATLLMLAMPPV